MFRKLFKAIFKLGLYAACAGAIWAAWDFMQQSNAAGDDYGVAEHMASLDDRYGDDVRELGANAVIFAQDGYASAVAWAEGQGVFDMIGMDAPVLEAPAEVETSAKVVPAGTEDATLVLASADAPLAPDTSLFPRARNTK